jgi:hypothetical protein
MHLVQVGFLSEVGRFETKFGGSCCSCLYVLAA